NRLVSSDLDDRTAVVKVAKGSRAADETVVTFTNGRAQGQLKVCKVAGSPDLLGDAFSFSTNGGPAFSVTAGSAASPGCPSLATWGGGPKSPGRGRPTAGTHTPAIDVSTRRGSGNLTTGVTNVTIGSGVTVATYTNVADPPAQTGYIEVCKEAS